MKTLYTTVGYDTFISSNYLWHNGKPYRIDCCFGRAIGGNWRYIGARVGEEYANANAGNEAYKFDCKEFAKTLPAKYKGFDPMLNLKAVTSVLKILDYAKYVEDLTAV